MISKIRGFFKIVEAVFIGNLLCCIPATLIVFGVDDIDRVPLVLFYSYIMFGITGTIL